MSLRRLHLAALVSLMLLGACEKPAEQAAAPAPAVPDAAAIAENNRGVALMGRFDYGPAVQTFAGLSEQYPDWLDARVNLAIATLNRQQEGDEQAALALVDGVLAEDPGHLRAHYVAGLLRLYLGAAAKAQAHFRTVAKADPQDAYAAYYLAQCLAQDGQHEEALGYYRRALDTDPYLRSAYYGVFQSLQRLRKPEEAREVIGDYQRLANNPRARLAEFKYTRMGTRGEALAMNLADPVQPPAPQGEVFEKPQALPIAADAMPAWLAPDKTRAAGLTAVDINRDGLLDLFVPNALEDDVAPNLLLLGQQGGGYVPQRDHPLAGVNNVNAALWGDYDNDGHVDVYLCRQGANQLWRNTGTGWENVTDATGTGNGDYSTIDGLFFDADHDGDLDLFLVNANGPDELLNNNLDGSFRAIAAERGIDGDTRASRAIIAADIDGDRDTDIVVLHAAPPHAVYLNDRLWRYHAAEGFDGFNAAPALAGVAGDVDADGIVELYTVDTEGQVLRWSPDAAGQYAADKLTRIELGDGSWVQLALADVTGDGTAELISASAAGWRASVPGTPEAGPLFSARMELAGVLPWVDDAATGPAVIAMHAGGLTLWPQGPGRYPFLALNFTGMEDAGQSMRSNASGIGARIELRRGSHWTVTDTFRRTSGPGQSRQPLAIGLGGATQADFIAIDWSDGVFQSEVALAAGELHTIRETQRQLSSCPVLFGWDGEKYAFVSDFLGVGGIGYAVAPGEYATPRPWENFLFPAGMLQPRNGEYVLKIAEPMEETAYLDAARLKAYDLPPGWDMVLDERMGILGPEPTGEPHFFRKELQPVRAINDRGADVLSDIAEADGRAAPVGKLDRRFIGRLQTEHVLTLEFEQPLDEFDGAPVLMADGWVEYPYSQTMFSAWQAGASFDAPTLEARARDGRWHTVLEQFGYPAGMPRRMSVPLDELPPGTTALRLRTNMEVYWDRLGVVYAEGPPAVDRHALELKQARLAKTGFATRIPLPQRRPLYDYQRRATFWDTRYMAGLYTRTGPVEELVQTVDDAVAIIGAGEEVHLVFNAGTPPREGYSRHLVLETNGWAKDMDMFTRDGETVGPLPDTGKPAAIRDALHARYNTRYHAGR